MRASTTIVQGAFFGADIEPGTFHRNLASARASVSPPNLVGSFGTSPASRADEDLKVRLERQPRVASDDVGDDVDESVQPDAELPTGDAA